MLGPLLLKKASDRKLRLFAVACCRRIQPHLSDQNGVERRLEIAERYADGFASEEELQTAQFPSRHGDVSFERFGYHAALDNAHLAALGSRSACEAVVDFGVAKPPTLDPKCRTERDAQCALLREIFGNPFRPIIFDPAWRTSDVMLLARGIYEEKAFAFMPILADALQDAGCDSADILTHLRDSHATHVRGCWALDLVLGKE
jgi:hypothetical protein